MQDLKQIVSARKEQEQAQQRANNYRQQIVVDALEVLKTASGRRLIKAMLGMAPKCLMAATEPYKDAFVLGRISYRADLQRFFTTEQLRLIEDET